MKYSVIVPVFNGQQYIISALNSVLEYKDNDIEIIVIDDGSTDNTVKIVRKIQDKRINLVEVNHLGVAKIRNLGVRIATGMYILFLDADDIFSTDLFKHLDEKIKENSDFIIFGWRPFKSKKDDMKFQKGNVKPTIDGMDSMVWNKLYLKELLKNIRLPEDTVFEDVAFSAQAYIRAKKVTFIDEPLYFYRQHSSSTTNKVYGPTQRLDIIADFRFLISDIVNEDIEVSKIETRQIGMLIHKVVYSHVRRILIENDIDSEAITVFRKFQLFLDTNLSLFPDRYSTSWLKNLKMKLIMKLIKWNQFRMLAFLFKNKK